MAASKPVLIAGGGIGGITAALCLARKGFGTVVFEQAPAFGEVGAGLQISPNGSRVLHYLGLASALRAHGTVPEGVEFRRWRSGEAIAAHPLGEDAQATYGFPYCHVHRSDLLRLLLAAAEQEDRIELRANANVRNVERHEPTVRIAVESGNGASIHEGIALIGADGIHSSVREALFGPAAPTFTGQVAWRALIPAAQLPDGMVRPTTTVWWGPSGHFVHYYVRRGTLVNCICVLEQSGWEVESWTEPGEHDELKAAVRGWHAEIRTLVEHMDPNALYKWALFDRAPLRRWGKGAVTLLGDACHPMLPFMAQGAASAIEDAAVLAACLAGGESVATRLRRYEALRRRRTAQLQRQARRNAKIFHWSGAMAWLRDQMAERFAPRLMDRVFRYDALTAAHNRSKAVHAVRSIAG